jgi:hypothetical protein
MAFTAAGMRTRYLSKLTALATSQTTDQSSAESQTDNILLALFEAIADEIHENARCSGTDTGTYGGDSHDTVQIV